MTPLTTLHPDDPAAVDYAGAQTTRMEPDPTPAAVFAGYLEQEREEDVYAKAVRRINAPSSKTVSAALALELAAPDEA